MYPKRFVVCAALVSAVLSPVLAMAHPALAAPETAAVSRPDDASAVNSAHQTGSVLVTVLPWQIAVLDGGGHIREVWSNTDQPAGEPLWRQGSIDGPTVDPTPQALAEYDGLQSLVAWSAAPGRVYVAPPTWGLRLTSVQTVVGP